MLDLFHILRNTQLADLSLSRTFFSQIRRLTGDIEVENVIFSRRIVNQLPTGLIHDQNFPLYVETGAPSVAVIDAEVRGRKYWGGEIMQYLVASCITNCIQDNYQSGVVSSHSIIGITSNV